MAINKILDKKDEVTLTLTADDAVAIAASALNKTAATANSAFNLDLSLIAEKS